MPIAPAPPRWLHTCPWHCPTSAPVTPFMPIGPEPDDSPLPAASSHTEGKHQIALSLPLPVTITKHEASAAEVSPKAAYSACFGPSPMAGT